jgi:osmoprotectant transport system permease protein
MDRLLLHLERLPDLLAAHVRLSLAALAIGIIFSVPLAVLVLKVRRLEAFVLGAASVVQTVPSLAFLALIVVATGVFGFPAALAALSAYSILPILRNTITGIRGVEPRVVEAARGLGMTDRQVLTRIELPLAAPVIIAGVRTAAVWTIGIATLSTPVGAPSLGDFIFSGLNSRDTMSVLVGVVFAAALALVVDALIRTGEVAASNRSPKLGLAAALGLGAVIAGALLPAALGNIGRSGDRLVVGAKDFTEQYILARVIASRLQGAGFDTQLRENVGSAVIFDAIAGGDVDVYVGYTGTIWANRMQRDDFLPNDEVLRLVEQYVAAEHGLTSLGPLGFENTYAVVVTEATAQRESLATIDDLARVAPRFTLGAPAEFWTRPEWVRLRDTYGLDFRETRSFDTSLMYEAVDQDAVDAIPAFSTDGRITAYGLEVLADPRRAFPPYDAIVLLSEDAAADPRVVETLGDLIGAISARRMREANMLVDVEGQTPTEAAAWLDSQLDESE